MHSTSLRVPFLASISIGTMLATAVAQQGAAAKPAANGHSGAAAAAPANAAHAAQLAGLPTSLQMVPGGPVDMGLDAEQFVNAACQVVSPSKPAMAVKLSPAKVTEAMKKSVSMLGRRKVDVEAFLLAKWSVKCSEYEAYLKHRRQAGGKMRPPFGWWRFGCKDDYEKHLPEIAKEYPKDPEGPVRYWERHGADLPYALLDENGKSIAEQAVTFVSWRDANEFAGWLGMRLPTEAEWTRAARGDSTQVWPLATSNPPADAFSDELLKQLKIFNTRDRVPKDAGTVPAAAGPFGHLDMFGHVWQLIGDLGYRPIHGPDLFAAEWKKLQKDDVGKLLQAPPQWRDEKVIAKGGSYLSTSDPIQLTIDARAPMLTYDVLESVGFRLAKSLKPGYDMMYSLLRGTYPRSQFALDQEVAIESQVGAERYELGADGFPTAYHAVSFAPVNWLAKEKNTELQKLVERSQTVPLLIGTLATTEPLADPAVAAGIWSVLFRHHGMPRELVEAIKSGHREMTNVVKSKPNGKEGEAKEGEPKPEEGEGDDGKKDKPKETWRTVIAKFGLTEQDVLGKEAADGHLKFVRIDGLEVPSDRDVYLLHGKIEDKSGQLKEGAVAWLPATNAKPANTTAFASKLVVEGNDKGKAVVKLHFGVSLSQANPKRVVEFHLPLTVDTPVPTADKPWRLPQ